MKKFLLIIDIQQGFIDKNTQTAKVRIDELVKSNIFDRVIASVYENFEGSPITRLMGWHGMTDSGDRKLAGEAVQADHFVCKTGYSAYCNSLVEFLKTENGGNEPECVFVCGVDTECCVLMTAADLFEAGIRPVVLTYYCGSSSGEKSHEAGVLSMESIVGRNNLYSGVVCSEQDIENAVKQAKKE